MKESVKKSPVVRLAVCAVLAAALFFLARGTQSKVASLFAMVFAVLFFEALLVLVLGLFKPKSHRTKTLLTISASLCKYVAALVILCWGLSILGVDISAIVASVGILTLVVGFGAESLIADVITGIFMLFENQYNVGDIVEVNGFRGTVKEIGIRTTAIMDVGGNVKIVNNSEMKSILNRSNNASVAVSDIDIPYGTDLEAFEEKLPALMQEIYERRKDVMNAAPNYLGVQNLGASGVTLRFTAEVPEDQIYKATRILNRDLLVGFRKLGVECPFPQVDVHSC
ncbi:MAG: mechanosensitive ion channel [Oscillospiraceae bacterium]|nr:mechanosensitive ion channel [Oscillospiraceae bacterium]